VDANALHIANCSIVSHRTKSEDTEQRLETQHQT